MRNAQNPTYYDLLNFYYKCGFPSILQGKANSVAHAIMFKWNELIRPAEFRMSNAELSYHSGVETHIGRERQKVTDECKVNATPLFIYISNGRQRAGTYKINTTLLPKSAKTEPKLSQTEPKVGHIVNDLRGRGEKEAETTTRGGGSFDASPNEENSTVPTTRINRQLFKWGVYEKYRGQIMDTPSDPQISGAFKEFPDVNVLLEALDRAPQVLRATDSEGKPIRPDAARAVNLVLKAARNPSYWRPKDDPAQPRQSDPPLQNAAYWENELDRYINDPGYEEDDPICRDYVELCHERISQAKERTNE